MTVLWTLVAIIIVAAGIFVYWLWTTKNARVGELGDRLNLMINVSMFVLTVVSIVIALAAFNDAKTSGDEQKKALDASRKSLEDVVQSAKAQTKLLQDAQSTLSSQLDVSRKQQGAMKATNSTLQNTNNTLKSQLEISTEQNKRELDRLSKKPVIQFSINGYREDQFLDMSIPSSKMSDLQFVVTNTGTAPLQSPSLMITALSPQITLYSAIAGGSGNHIQFSGPSVVQSIEPQSQIGSGYSFDFSLSAPETVPDVMLILRIYGSNMALKQTVAHLKIVWPPKENKQ